MWTSASKPPIESRAFQSHSVILGSWQVLVWVLLLVRDEFFKCSERLRECIARLLRVIESYREFSSFSSIVREFFTCYEAFARATTSSESVLSIATSFYECLRAFRDLKDEFFESSETFSRAPTSFSSGSFACFRVWNQEPSTYELFTRAFYAFKRERFTSSRELLRSTSFGRLV